MRDSYALVLSGGGAKGVYHIGVWKALKEIGVEVDAFVGSSAGAVAAAFLAQGLDDALEDLAGKIGLDWVLNIPECLVRDGELTVNRGNRRSFRRFYRSVIAEGGLDTSPLRGLLEEYIDEDEIRKRGKDLGIVAYSITEMRPAEIFIDEMERGRLVDYILASSAFPGFHQPRIGGRRYMDGGIFENIPFAMARRRGCRNIIVSDIGGMGVNRRPNNAHIRGTRTVYIRASLDMGGVLDFNRDFLRRFSRLGYLDTMRTFGCLHGRRYFIRPDGDEEKRFDAFLERPEIKRKLRRALGNSGGGEGPGGGESVNRLFPRSVRQYRPRLALCADCAARVLSLEAVRDWSYGEIRDEMLKRAEEIRLGVSRLDAHSLRRKQRLIRRERDERRLPGNPYFYFLLAERGSNTRVRALLHRLLDEVFPELPSGVFFLEILEDYVKAGGEENPRRYPFKRSRLTRSRRR